LPRLKALGYLKLNVFEIVFAVLPRGKAHVVWAAYFEDSLKRCSILRDELSHQPEIYHAGLIAAYKKWRSGEDTGGGVRSSPALPRVRSTARPSEGAAPYGVFSFRPVGPGSGRIGRGSTNPSSCTAGLGPNHTKALREPVNRTPYCFRIATTEAG
jgi:hypothetical protein